MRSLFGEELERAVGRGDLAHGVGTPLVEAGGRGGLVVDVDTVVGPLHRWGAGRAAEQSRKAEEKKKNRKMERERVREDTYQRP